MTAWNQFFSGSTMCVVLFLNSCNSVPAPSVATQNINDQSLRTVNQRLTENTISLLRTGDVVLRRGRGPDSYILAHLNLKDPSWSHCGIVVVENGYPFVYHSIGGEDNPDERLRRDSAAFFFSPVNNYGIGIVRYKITTKNIDDLVKTVHNWYAARPKFDLQFDLATDDKLYCSEFVYKSFTRTLHDTAFIPLSTGHGTRFVGIDDLFLNENAYFVTKVNYN